MNFLGTALALMILAAPVTFVAAAEQDDFVQKAETAKTAADHEALATHYDQLAADARKEAAMHKEMAKTYGSGSSSGKGTFVKMPQHCTAIAKNLEATAKEYDAMARAHRELAKKLAK